METFSALLAICAGNSPVTGEIPTQRPVTRSFDVFLDLRLNKQLSKQPWGWWFESLSGPLWRHRNESGPPCWRQLSHPRLQTQQSEPIGTLPLIIYSWVRKSDTEATYSWCYDVYACVALPALFVGYPKANGWFPFKRQVMWNFDVYLVASLN